MVTWRLGRKRSINKTTHNRLLKNLPSGNEYYTKDSVIDTSKIENLKKVQEKYKNGLKFMLQELD